MLTNNRIWRNRTVDIGVVTAEDALNYGFRWGDETWTLGMGGPALASWLQERGCLPCHTEFVPRGLGAWGTLKKRAPPPCRVQVV